MLVTVGLAKIVLGKQAPLNLLTEKNPIFSIQNQYIYFVVGAVETVIGVGCFFVPNARIPAMGIVWLAGNVLLYRFGLWWLDYKGQCNCLGSIGEVFKLTSEQVEWISIVCLGVLIVGSFSVIILTARRTSVSNGPSIRGA